MRGPPPFGSDHSVGSQTTKGPRTLESADSLSKHTALSTHPKKRLGGRNLSSLFQGQPTPTRAGRNQDRSAGYRPEIRVGVLRKMLDVGEAPWIGSGCSEKCARRSAAWCCPSRGELLRSVLE